MKSSRIVLGVFSVFVLCFLATCKKDEEVKTGSVRGIVMDEASQKPVPKAHIYLFDYFSYDTWSDSVGYYEINDVPVGKYLIRGLGDGYLDYEESITIKEGQAVVRNIPLRENYIGFALDQDIIDFGEDLSEITLKIINKSLFASIYWEISHSIPWLTVSSSWDVISCGKTQKIQLKINRDLLEQSTTAYITLTVEEQTFTIPVNVVVPGTETPKLQVSGNVLDFGGSASSLQFFVMNTGPSSTSLNWVCTNNSEEWLTLLPNAAVTSGGQSTPVTATIDRTKIEGSVSTSLFVRGAGESFEIAVKASSDGDETAILQLSEGSLYFDENLTTMSFLVYNIGAANTYLQWSIDTPEADWLTLAPMSGTVVAGNCATVVATIDRSKFDGFVSQIITINSSCNSAKISVSALNSHPKIEVSPSTVDFGKESVSNSFTIQNAGTEGSTLNWHIVDPSVDWLTVSPKSGQLYYHQSQPVELLVDRTKFNDDVATTLIVESDGQNAVVNIIASSPDPILELPVALVEFDLYDYEKTFEIRNTGEPGSNLNWSIAPPSVEWLTVSPMSGTAKVDTASVVTLTVDRLSFVGLEETDLTISGGGSTATMNVKVDNSILLYSGLNQLFTFDNNEVMTYWGTVVGENHGVVFSDDTPSGEGHSLQFDGDSSYVYLRSGPISCNNRHSINFWFKTNKTDQAFYGTNENSNYGPCYLMGITADAKVFIKFDKDHGWTSTNSIAAYLDNQWHMLTFTFDENRANYYIDGTLLETTAAEGLYWSIYISGFYFGKHSSTGVYKGKLDNFRTHIYPLSVEEIRALYKFKQ